MKSKSEQIIQDFATAWETAEPELIIKHLSERFVYDSQWVFESLDHEGYVNYIRGKMATIKRNNAMPEVKIVDDPHYGGKMLELKQNGKPCYYRIRIEEEKVVKGDMCAFQERTNLA